MRFAWPLAGRREEMQAITGAIGDPNVVGMVVCGPAGVGKWTLSVRTVEGHIYRAMAMTGATDRAELARMLPRETADT